jgi:hypothetical protein
MADNEWMPVTIECDGQQHEGAYQIEGDTLAVMYRGEIKEVELGKVPAEALAKLVLGEMIEEG